MMVAGTRLLTAEVERNQGIQSILYLIETTEFGETAIWERSMYRLECLGGIHQRRSRYVGRQQQVLFWFCRVSQSAVGHDSLEVRKSPV